MYSELYNVLKSIDPKPEELADALWLANYAPPSESVAVKALHDQAKDLPLDLDQERGLDVPEQAGPRPDARSDLYPSLDFDSTESGAGIPARRFRTPGGMALQSQLDIVRALRPLKRTIASQTHFTLDIPATIKAIADRDEWLPILKPQQERWLDVVLIVDEWSSMAIWYQTLKEFQTLIETSGIFRQIKVWGMYPEAEPIEGQPMGTAGMGVRLHEGWGYGTTNHRTKSAKELINPSNDQLILLLSDCVSPAWRNGAISQLFKMWYQTNTVVIFQVLPYTLWERTSLGYAPTTWLSFPTPGAVNSALNIQEEETLFDDEPDDEEPATVAVPVVTFDHDLLLNLSKAVAGASQQWLRGYLLPIEGQTQSLSIGSGDKPIAQPQKPSAEQLVETFQAVASRPAQQLAAYFSTMQALTLPLMHTIQRVMLPDSTPGHLAEVFLSGLIERPETATVEGTHPYQIPYTFVSGVPVRLQATILKGDIHEVLQKTLAEFIDQRSGQSLDFEALIADPTSTENLEILQGGEAFAAVSVDLLYRLGGGYAELARGLDAYSQHTQNVQRDISTSREVGISSSDVEFSEQKEVYEISDIISEIEMFQDPLDFYRSTGDWEQAVDYYMQSLVDLERENDIAGLAATYFSLGNIYQSESKPQQAEGYYKLSLKMFDQMGDTYCVAQTRKNLGEVSQFTGKFDQATEEYLKALKLFEELDDIQFIAETKLNLGRVYVNKGDWNKAIDCYQQALEIFDHMGDLHGSAQTIGHLGTVYHAKKDWDQAITYYQQSLEILNGMGDNIHGATSIYNNLGNIYQTKGELDKAIRYYQQSLTVSEELDDLQSMAQSYNDLGNISQTTHEIDKALNYYQQSLAIFEQLGDVHGVGTVYKNLGEVYHFKEELNRAISYYQQALEIDKQVDDIQGTATTYYQLGVVAHKMNQWSQAESYLQQALQTYIELKDYRSQANTYSQLGIVYQKQGQWEQATTYHDHALQIYAEINDHYGEGNVHRQLGGIAQKIGDFRQAEEHYKNALHIFEEGHYTHDTARIYDNLSGVYYLLQQFKDAAHMNLKSIDAYEKVGDLASVAGSKINLANFYTYTKEYSRAINIALESLELSRILSIPQGVSTACQTLAETYLILGQLEDAQKYANIIIETEETASIPDALRVLGEIELKQGNHTQAQQHIQQSIDLAVKNQDPFLEAYGWRVLGQVYHAQLDEAEAKVSFDRAIVLFEKMGLEHEIDKTKVLAIDNEVQKAS